MTTMHRLNATQQGGPMALTTVPKSLPDTDEVLIRPKAVGLNPVDAKSLYYGAVVPSWPIVLGIEVAGIVDSVGDNVTAFKPGDEVFALSTRIINGERGSAFQEFVAVPQQFVGRKPVSLMFEEGASVAVAYAAAVSAIVNGLGLSIPGLPNPTNPSTSAPTPTSILVIGGSSACGGHVIQLLRQTLGPSAHIVTTSSPQHHAYLTTTLGATAALDRASAQLPENLDELRKAASGSADGTGFDAVVDCVGASLEQPHLFGALRVSDDDNAPPKVYAQIFTGPTDLAAPEGVAYRRVMATQLFNGPEKGAGVFELFGKLLEDGYKLPVEVEVVGSGWDAVEGGLLRLSKGVSRTKLVVSV
ncbi:chaperonin 10-like protein [Coniella lustricola]|uniref:Chaperonin 10-like protein n=1 Tax=Coniella lustricola TaxID=2025994 RepID=A0A2T3A1X2_9PEZI|nr:chaperonin 10-like protein [Coniella lustricola]